MVFGYVQTSPYSYDVLRKCRLIVLAFSIPMLSVVAVAILCHGVCPGRGSGRGRGGGLGGVWDPQ